MAINTNQTKSYEIHLQNCYQSIQLRKANVLIRLNCLCVAISCTLLDSMSFNPITYSFEHEPSTICFFYIGNQTMNRIGVRSKRIIFDWQKCLSCLLIVQNFVCAQLVWRFFWIATRTKMATTNHKTTIYAREHSYFVEFRLEFSSLKLENKM